MMPSKPLIADIQRFSLHDGPGIRTTVFFKGCPLNCAWCHNPECISFAPETLFYPHRCVGCGGCAEGCFSDAKVLCGREYTPEELMEEIRRDLSYYGEEGGVTFSGGEPLCQRDFLLEMLLRCRKEGIHTALETSLILFDEEVFRNTDLILADLKIWDDALHRKFTGVSVEPIKNHFLRLGTLSTPVRGATPVIPEIHQGIEEISRFLYGIETVREYVLLPYHPIGTQKAEALGKKQRAFSVPTEEFMKEARQYAFIR
ncbi:MAG: radical SAM protein [Clostridia bacterium]|nr:radical SAM protein [Clostridia bacterium]